jgi:hypothetical protein
MLLVQYKLNNYISKIRVFLLIAPNGMLCMFHAYPNEHDYYIPLYFRGHFIPYRDSKYTHSIHRPTKIAYRRICLLSSEYMNPKGKC